MILIRKGRFTWSFRSAPSQHRKSPSSQLQPEPTSSFLPHCSSFSSITYASAPFVHLFTSLRPPSFGNIRPGLHYHWLHTRQNVRIRSKERVPRRGSSKCSPVSSSGLDADFSLQTIVVTGGSDGMGRAVALQLASQGANVVVVARTVSKLERTVADMKVRVCSSFGNDVNFAHASSRLKLPIRKSSASSTSPQTSLMPVSVSV